MAHVCWLHSTSIWLFGIYFSSCNIQWKDIPINIVILIFLAPSAPQQAVYHLYGWRKITKSPHIWEIPGCVKSVWMTPRFTVGEKRSKIKYRKPPDSCTKPADQSLTPSGSCWVCWGGEVEGHKEDHGAVEGGRHTRQSIVGHLTLARVPHTPNPAPSYPMKRQSRVNNTKRGQMLTWPLQNTRAAPPVTAHLRLKRRIQH